MSLFTQKKSTLTTSSIPSVVVRTSNVAKELLIMAQTHNVSIKSIDFRILETQTFLRTISEGDDWIELNKQEIEDISDEMYLSPKFELKQIYEIEIFSLSETKELALLDLSIGGNSTLCKIYLTIKPNSIATYSETFERDFFELVKKKKLRANLMIGIFDSMLRSVFSELIAKVRVHKIYRFETQERYVVAEGFEPVATIDDKLILHYDTKRKNMDEVGRVDYAKRGYIVSVVQNDLLIEYIKPKKGETGRNCRGEIILPKEPSIRNEPTFTFSDKIRQVDTPQNSEWRAAVGGYVTFEGGMYDIKTEIDIKEISFRSTGSIETKLDADVSINVKEKDILKDAVGTGMEVKVNTIRIEGNVGSEAKVTAHKATVEGQVHSSATIRADELSINIHKGTAYGKEIHITRLEHGTVEGERVFIGQAIGGKVRAKEIIIELLGSHVKLSASSRIEIKKLQGGENVLTIDPLLNKETEFLEQELKKISEAKKALNKSEKELLDYETTMKENEVAFEDIKKKIIHYKRNDIKVPIAYIQKYKNFLLFRRKLEGLRDDHTKKSEYFALMNEEYTALQNEIFDARIINHGQWNNYNEIIFKLIEPAIDVTYVPQEGSNESVLGLHEDENGEFSIKVVSK